MPLPTISLPTATVELNGAGSVAVRGLSRGEALDVSRFSDGDAADTAEMEAMVLAFGTDTPLDEARRWHRTAPFHAVQPLIEKIMELSGLDGLGKGSSEA